MKRLAGGARLRWAAMLLLTSCAGDGVLTAAPRGEADAMGDHLPTDGGDDGDAAAADGHTDVADAGEADALATDGEADAATAADAGDTGTVDEPVEPEPQPPTVTHQAFRVMSYNVRHETADDTGRYAWSERKGAVIERIVANRPDIIGIQEASGRVDADLIAGLTGDDKDFEVFNPRGASPKIIFYRKDRFTWDQTLRSGRLELPNPYASSHECFDNARNRSAGWFFARDRLSDEVYLIVNAHTAHAAACGTARVRAAEAIGHLVRTEGEGRQVIVLGDLNTDPQSGGTRGETTIEVLEDAGLFRTVRHDETTSSSQGTFNKAWKSGGATGGARLDWILQSGGPITSSAPFIDDTIVGGRTPSDHFAIGATIRPAIFRKAAIFNAVPNGASASTRLVYADVTGDGCADQLAWNPTVGEGETWVSESDCQGRFAAAVASAQGSSKAAARRFAFADVNGDRCADELDWQHDVDGGALRILLSQCDGRFAPAVRIEGAGGARATTQLFFGDVTGDRCADIVRWDPAADGGRFETLVAACDGAAPGFGAPVVTDAGPNTDGATRVWLADVDGDGQADRIVWHPAQAGGKTRVYRSTGDGRFEHLFDHGSGTSGVSETRLSFADVDGDRKADKIFWRPKYREGRAQIYLSTGAQFASAPILDNTGYSNSDATRFSYAPIDGTLGCEKVYWNPTNYDGQSKVFLAGAQ